MKSMFVALSLLSATAFADENDDRFNQAKEKMISNFDQRISAMTTAKACIQKATTHEELKVCQNAFRESMKQIQGDNKAKRRALLKERAEKRAEKKANQ